MKHFLALLLFAVALPAQAWYCEKDVANMTECLTYTTNVIDYLQTRQIRKTEGIYEVNDSVCGRQPGEFCTAKWFATRIAWVYFVNHHAPFRDTKILGMKARAYWNIWYIHDQLGDINHNFNIGLKVKF